MSIATHDQRAVIQSIMELDAVGRLLNRPVQFVIGEGATIPESRNRIVEAIQEQYPQDPAVWMLWLDSDILIRPGNALIMGEAFKWAEDQQCCVVANYRMATGQNVLISTRQAHNLRHYTDDELANLPGPYPAISLAGLGFTYLYQPLSYRFYADTVGEDIHLWWDHPEIQLHWIDRLRLVHRKAIMLADPTPERRDTYGKRCER